MVSRKQVWQEPLVWSMGTRCLNTMANCTEISPSPILFFAHWLQSHFRLAIMAALLSILVSKSPFWRVAFSVQIHISARIFTLQSKVRLCGNNVFERSRFSRQLALASISLVMYRTQSSQTFWTLRSGLAFYAAVNVEVCVVPSFLWPTYPHCWASDIVFMLAF